MRSHFDVIQKISYIEDHNCLVSISEDCLINVWLLDKLNFKNQLSDINPLITLRGHSGPLFSLETHNNIIYTAGNEGIIKVWSLPKINSNDNIDETSSLHQTLQSNHNYSDVEDIFNSNIGYHINTNEVIWDLKHHPTSNILASLSADGSIYFYKTGSVEDYISALTQENIDKWYLNSIKCIDSSNQYVYPIAGYYLNNNNNILACGLSNGNISFVDIQNFTVANCTNDSNEFNSLYNQNQINCINSSIDNDILFAGYENGSLKCYDFRDKYSNFIPINAHEDAITSISVFNSIYLFTTSHDTRIKLWDVRDLSEPIQETLGSQKKWDIGICDSVFLHNEMALATAGADSVIKIFKL